MPSIQLRESCIFDAAARSLQPRSRRSTSHSPSISIERNASGGATRSQERSAFRGSLGVIPPRDRRVACPTRGYGLRGRPGRERQRPEWHRSTAIGCGCRSVAVYEPNQVTLPRVAGLGAHDATQLWIACHHAHMTIAARATTISLRMHVSHPPPRSCKCTPSSSCRTDASRYRRPPVSREDWSAALCAAHTTMCLHLHLQTRPRRRRADRRGGVCR
jgi:hypothetical protein